MSEWLAQSQELGWKMTLERERNEEEERGRVEEEKVRCLPTKEKRGSRWGKEETNRGKRQQQEIRK